MIEVKAGGGHSQTWRARRGGGTVHAADTVYAPDYLQPDRKRRSLAVNVSLSYAVDYAALQAQGLASPDRTQVGQALNTILAGGAGDFAQVAGRLAAMPSAAALAAGFAPRLAAVLPASLRRTFALHHVRSHFNETGGRPCARPSRS